ncbi:MAG: hypothetical protein NTW79_01165 [Candidatus Berkelbacteria bacterium]|nr:hypothetical protein [Candidatus Berkelbacteria bacterium]
MTKKKFSTIFWQFLGRHRLFFLCAPIIVAIILPAIRQPGIPFKYDWSWPIFNSSEVWRQLFSQTNFGVVSAFGKYATVLLGFFGLLHITPGIAFKIFIPLTSVFAAYGFYLFTSRRSGSKLIAFFVGLAYGLSPYIFIRTIVGFEFSLIAAAALPFFLDGYFNERKKSFCRYLYLAFLLSLIISQIQAGVLTIFFLIVEVFVWPKRKIIVGKIINLSKLALAMIVANSPWVIIGLASRTATTTGSAGQAVTLKFIADLPHSLRNVLMLSDHHITIDYFYPLSKLPVILLAFGLIYLIAFLAIFDHKNRHLVLALIVSSLLILPFTIGPTKFFTGFYTFVFNHFSLLAVFRETYHFEFLLAFSLISLFVFGANTIVSKISGKIGRVAVIAITFFLTLAIIWPYFSFNYAGFLPLQQIPEEYNQAANFFQSNKNYCQKVYYPPSLDFNYFLNDNSPAAANSDLIALALGIPYLTEDSSQLVLPSSQMYERNKITSHFLEPNDNGETAALLQSAGVDCAIVRADMGSKYYQVSGILGEKNLTIRDKWMNDDMKTLAENKKGLYLDRQFGNRIFIYKISNDKLQISNETGENPNIQKFKDDSSMTFLPLSDWATEFSNYKDGWTRGRYFFWRKLLFANLGQDFIYTDAAGSTLGGKITETGDYDLQVRYLDGDGGTAGNFKLQISNSKYEIQKNLGEEKFARKDLGKISIKKGDSVTITNVSGENAIADVVLTRR